MTLFLFGLLQLTEAVLNGIPAGTSPDISPTLPLTCRFPGGRRSVCGGVAISRQLVLTSKHCLYRQGIRASDVELTRSGYAGGEETPWRSTSFVELPESGHDINDDLALLRLQPALPFCDFHQSKVARLPLPTGYQETIQDKELEGAVCSAAGWGINESNEFSRRPLTAYVHLHFEEHGYKRPVLVATYHNSETRFCAGDSGSPVFCWLRGSAHLVGLLSEIGGDARMDPRKNWTMAEQCARQEYVLVTDLRHQLAEMAALFPGHLVEGQRFCGFV